MGDLPPLPSGPVGSIDEAIARMQEIGAALSETDGLACFNRMYLIVTETVGSKVSDGFFADPAFMARLDVVFVNLYLAAIDAFRAQPPAAPQSWSILLSRRSDGSITPMQFALAGMNAHINHDLPVAVVTACNDLGGTPGTGGRQEDYEKVNHILGSLDEQIRQSFETGPILELDRKAAGLENLVGNFGIDAARETAWVNALTLWHLKGVSWLYRQYLGGLDRTVAYAGRSLLIPFL